MAAFISEDQLGLHQSMPNIVRPLLPLMSGSNAGGSGRYPYLVDPLNGSDRASGVGGWPDAFKTLQKAIDQCKDNIGDRILLRPRSQTVTATVNFNKKGIIVQTVDIGYNTPSRGERFYLQCATAATPVATFTEPCRIEGVGFLATNAAGGIVKTGPGSGFDGGNFVHFKNCRFPNWNGAIYAIETNVNDFVMVEECDIDGTINGESGGANNFTAGILFPQGHYCTVKNTVFKGCTVGILHLAVAPGGAAHGNMMFLYEGNKCLGRFPLCDFGAIGTETNQKGIVINNYIPMVVTAAYLANGATTVAALEAVNVDFMGNHYKTT